MWVRYACTTCMCMGQCGDIITVCSVCVCVCVCVCVWCHWVCVHHLQECVCVRIVCDGVHLCGDMCVCLTQCACVVRCACAPVVGCVGTVTLSQSQCRKGVVALYSSSRCSTSMTKSVSVARRAQSRASFSDTSDAKKKMFPAEGHTELRMRGTHGSPESRVTCTSLQRKFLQRLESSVSPTYA